MSLRINTNSYAMRAGLTAGKTHQALNDSLERISSGKRINAASDDASGMTIASRLKSRSMGLGQAAENASNGIAIAQIADGALGQVSDMIQTIRTRAVEAAGPGQSDSSRQAIQQDIQGTLEAINDIAGQTSYNGQSLLSGAFTNKQFSLGGSSGESVTISIENTAASNLGSSETGSLADIDVTTAEGAQAAIDIADQALDQVNATRSNVGSVQNQFESTINNLDTTRINLMEAESQIMDVDLAEESMNLNRLKVLEKANAFALAQANTNQKNVINLLS